MGVPTRVRDSTSAGMMRVNAALLRHAQGDAESMRNFRTLTFFDASSYNVEIDHCNTSVAYAWGVYAVNVCTGLLALI